MRKCIKKIKNLAKHRKIRRKLSIRNKINGNAEIPRICVVKTNKHLSVQVIDDISGNTLFSTCTYGKNVIEGAKKNIKGAEVIG
ncbi:MAG: 50S ribosomal protein L18, partial [Oligoflexia bacterium]|nr:50S ribosomal protein L18 [Oligoflexia bacterium]